MATATSLLVGPNKAGQEEIPILDPNVFPTMTWSSSKDDDIDNVADVDAGRRTGAIFRYWCEEHLN